VCGDHKIEHWAANSIYFHNGLIGTIYKETSGYIWQMSLFNIHNRDPNFIVELVLASTKMKMFVGFKPFRLFCFALVQGKLGKTLSFFQPKKLGFLNFLQCKFD
jgi:hypothetical protein